MKHTVRTYATFHLNNSKMDKNTELTMPLNRNCLNVFSSIQSTISVSIIRHLGPVSLTDDET